MAIPYPSNYFDPYGDGPTRAQCSICCENKDIDDFDQDTLDEFIDITGERIVEGICEDCRQKGEPDDSN